MPRRVPGWFALGATALLEHVVARATGRPPLADVDEVRMGLLVRYFDNTRARTELGFRPRPLRETLERTVRWMRQVDRSKGIRNEDHLASARGTGRETGE